MTGLLWRRLAPGQRHTGRPIVPFGVQSLETDPPLGYLAPYGAVAKW